MDNLIETVQAERAKYGATMSGAECVELCNAVAWTHRSDGWGVSYKDSGEHALRYDGTPCSVDVIHHQPSNVVVDILIAAGAASTPTWNVLGPNTQTSRPWTAPIQPQGQAARIRIGATLFCAVDLFLHDRAIGEAEMAWYRDECGATCIRPFWKKGTRGDPGDFWAGLVQDLSSLSTSLMREVMDWVQQQRLRMAHGVFADNLGMTDDEQDAFVHRFILAAEAERDGIEYVEVFNEPYPAGGGHGGESGVLRRHGRRLRAGLGPDVLISLGSPQAHMGLSTADLQAQVSRMYGGDAGGANLITVHFDRSVNRPPNLGPDAPRLRSNGEPRGPGSSNAETSDPAVIADDIQASIDGGYGWYIYHSAPGIRPRSQRVWDVPNAAAIARVLKAFSAGTPIEPGGGTGGGGDDVQAYPDEQTWWPQYEADVAALYQRAFEAGKRASADPDWAAMRWFSRMGHSSAHADLERAKQKHLDELAGALGVSR